MELTATEDVLIVVILALFLIAALSYLGWRHVLKLLRQLRAKVQNCAGFRGREEIPMHWVNFHKDIAHALTRSDPDFFDDHYPVDVETRDWLQELMEATCKDVEHHFHIVRAVRIENSAMWAAYQTKAARVIRKRGDCEYVGRGEPSTLSALSADAYEHLADGLDPNICEALLWHGSSPHTALKIAHEGFHISNASAHGTRFGTGGYFAENSSKADTYASAGEGIYNDCYAMLLCRVILGKQFLVQDFRQEKATELAGRKHDSTLAEPRGSSTREFIAFESSQVYPEYAIVYERLLESKRKMSKMRTDDSEGSTFGVNFSGLYPGYWFSSNNPNGNFHETYPDEEMLDIAQSAIESTWSRSATDDRKGAIPDGLRVLKVTRLEDHYMWNKYKKAQRFLRDAWGGSGFASRVPLSTAGLPRNLRRWLQPELNEVFLFAGLSPAAAMSLLEGQSACRENLQSTGRFGEGMYFTEASSKADEVSEDEKDGYYEGIYAMLLCRVTLGSVLDVKGEDPSAHKLVGPHSDYDSVCGWRPAGEGSYREFVVPDRSFTYPEYVIMYEREHPPSAANDVGSEEDSDELQNDTLLV